MQDRNLVFFNHLFWQLVLVCVHHTSYYFLIWYIHSIHKFIPIIQCNQWQQPTGKSGSNSPTSSISFNPSLPIPTLITCHVSQSHLQEEAGRAGYCNSQWHCYACAFQNLLGHISSKDASEVPAHGGYPESLGVGVVPRQALGAAPAPGHHQDTLRESPHNTCAQQPANPICLPDKPLHILSRKDFRTTAKHTPLSIVPASCCHHKATWDGWRWGPTTEQIWHFLMDMQAVQDTQAKAGQEATQGTTAGVSDTSSHCVLIPPCQLHSLHGLLWMLHQVHSGVKV